MQETRTSDIHCLDLESWTWSEMCVCHCYYWYYNFAKFAFDCIVQNMFSRIPVSTTPVGRSWHTLTAVSDGTLFLFGGLSLDCKPMSKKMRPHCFTFISSVPLIFFFFQISLNCFLFIKKHILLRQVMGGCLMLKQRNGEKSSIPIRISQGSKVSVPGRCCAFINEPKVSGRFIH